MGEESIRDIALTNASAGSRSCLALCQSAGCYKACDEKTCVRTVAGPMAISDVHLCRIPPDGIDQTTEPTIRHNHLHNSQN